VAMAHRAVPRCCPATADGKQVDEQFDGRTVVQESLNDPDPCGWVAGGSSKAKAAGSDGAEKVQLSPVRTRKALSLKSGIDVLPSIPIQVNVVQDEMIKVESTHFHADRFLQQRCKEHLDAQRQESTSSAAPVQVIPGTLTAAAKVDAPDSITCLADIAQIGSFVSPAVDAVSRAGNIALQARNATALVFDEVVDAGSCAENIALQARTASALVFNED